ncbi:MAG: hypothetical protein ACJ74P_04885 [Gaiellaceae bacterium]
MHTVSTVARGSRRAAFLARRPSSVLVPLLALQWLILLLLARRADHDSWLFGKTGAATHSYSAAWTVVHRHLPPPVVGYAWPLLTAPLAAVAGADYLDALPVLVLVQTLVVLPLALFGMYGIGARIGGRWLGYASAAGWIVLPCVAVAVSNAGYRPAFETALLPHGLGLSGDGTLAGTVCVIGAAYFALASLESRDEVHAVLAGLAAGLAIAFDAANALFLLAPAVGFACARRGRSLLLFALALLPAVATLALWQSRGVGHFPHIDVTVSPHRLELLRQGFRDAFYSDRVAEAACVGGLVGIARRSWTASAFVAAWFLPYVLVRGSAPEAAFGTGGWYVALMPAFPAFVVAVCSLPLLVPRLGERLARARDVPPPRSVDRNDRRLLAAAAVLSAVPLLVVAVLPVEKKPVVVFYGADDALVPVVARLKPATGAKPGTVYLQWPAVKTLAEASPFYVIFRSPASAPAGLACGGRGAVRCELAMQRLATTSDPAYGDVEPPVPAGRWTYRIGLAANAQRDPQGGGLMLLSPPVDVTVPPRP